MVGEELINILNEEILDYNRVIGIKVFYENSKMILYFQGYMDGHFQFISEEIETFLGMYEEDTEMEKLEVQKRIIIKVV